MKLIDQLLEINSKAQVQKVVNWIGNEQKRFDELIHLINTEPMPIPDRAAWVLGHCGEQQPQLLQSHWKCLIKLLQNQPSKALERNIMRALQYIEYIPETYQGQVVNCCVSIIENLKSAIANKVFALSVLYQISQQYTELQAEIKRLIEQQLPHASAGFRSRARKILQQMNDS